MRTASIVFHSIAYNLSKKAVYGWSGPTFGEIVEIVAEGTEVVAPSCVVGGLYSRQFLTNSDIRVEASPVSGTCVEMRGQFEAHDPRMWYFKHTGTSLINGACAL